MDARRFAQLSDPFPMWRGGELHGARIAYETWGELNAAREQRHPAVHRAFAVGARAALRSEDTSEGWWEAHDRPRRLSIDTDRYFVICVNSLGSCFGSTGPASINPATGAPYRMSFPDLSVEDIARGGFETLRSLGIERADTIIGPSLGGMVGARIRRAVSRRRAASDQHLRHGRRHHRLRSRSARSSAKRSCAIRTGVDGAYTDERPPATGMRIARKLGMMTYRSATEWVQRFGRDPVPQDLREEGPFAPEFAIQSYLEAHARRFVRAFDPNCYLYISRGMDRFDLAKHGASNVDALKRSGVEHALVIGVESDMLFAIAEQRALAEDFAKAGVTTRYAPLDCIEGHDSFLIDIERFGDEMRAFLR